MNSLSTVNIKVPPTRAAILRWIQGRSARDLLTSSIFVGNPVAELYEELIDAICYCDQILLDGGNHEPWKSIRYDLLELANTVYETVNPEAAQEGPPSRKQGGA